jgi:hypothetical protein
LPTPRNDGGRKRHGRERQPGGNGRSDKTGVVRDLGVAHRLCGTVTIVVADPIAPATVCALIVIQQNRSQVVRHGDGEIGPAVQVHIGHDD